MDRIKVLVASKSQIYALGLFHLLAEDERIEVFNHAHSGQYVIDVVGKINPDIILIDSELLNYDRAGVHKTLHELYSEVKVIVLITPENMRTFLDDAINAGVRGIMPKNISPMELVKGVVETAEFGAAIHPTVMPQILEKMMARIQGKPVEKPLWSDRERDIMELAAEGKSNRAIADILFISVNTVKSHIKRICDKLNVDNRIEIARYVLLDKKTEN